ncbi:MAG TPA: FHA domain-containing protein [Phycisphaerales bacterium]|nr:FHA domain-containing protein [Phycisphaerales bacterium]HMP38449.1 FHA domain-containing protein [Phycisphaerales bacterium]
MFELHVCTLRGRLLRAFPVGDRAELILGRDETCDIQIRSPKVAEEHCAIEPEGEQLVLRDLGSREGTLVEGQRIQKVRVEGGLEVVVGPALIRFIETR